MSVGVLIEERGTRALEYLARVDDLSRPEEQARLFAAAYSLRESLGVPPPKSERNDVERCLAEVGASLGEARFAAAWAEGASMSIERVVMRALDENQSALCQSNRPSRAGHPARLTPGRASPPLQLNIPL